MLCETEGTCRHHSPDSAAFLLLLSPLLSSEAQYTYCKFLLSLISDLKANCQLQKRPCQKRRATIAPSLAPV